MVNIFKIPGIKRKDECSIDLYLISKIRIKLDIFFTKKISEAEK